MTRVRSVGVLQNGKFLGAFYGLISIPFAAIFLLIGLVTGKFMAIFFVLMPIGYGIVGFLGAAFISILYNLVARMVGGIEVELE